MAVKYGKNEAGFSVVEMVVTMLIMLAIMGLVTTLFSRSLSTRSRESSRTDALTAAQAALNVMSREISNSGYATITNGIMNDSNRLNLHFVTNLNNDGNLTGIGENVSYFFEPSTQSILRYDANGVSAGNGVTSIIINRISSVKFRYFDYTGASPSPVPLTGSDTPTANTGRVRITLTVNMEDVVHQVKNDKVTLTSDVTLRNSSYMLKNY